MYILFTSRGILRGIFSLSPEQEAIDCKKYIKITSWCHSLAPCDLCHQFFGVWCCLKFRNSEESTSRRIDCKKYIKITSWCHSVAPCDLCHQFFGVWCCLEFRNSKGSTSRRTVQRPRFVPNIYHNNTLLKLFFWSNTSLNIVGGRSG